MTLNEHTIAEPSVDRASARRRSALRKWMGCEGQNVPLRSSWPQSLRRIRIIGLIVILIGFIGLAMWSSFLSNRFLLTHDYGFYGQGWYLIAHGNLDPYSTLFPPAFWKNAFELIMWPLAPLWYVWPHTVTLLWVQDAATAATEAVLFVWMCEITAVAIHRGRLRAWPAIFPACGLILLVASPWTIWIDSFDFHPESLDLLLAVLAAHAFWKGRNYRGWAAALLALGAGAIGATYVAGVGISALLAGRRWRRIGAVLIVFGIAWLLLVSRIGGDQNTSIYQHLAVGSHSRSLSTLTLLKSIFQHPSRAISTVWSVRVNIFANISSGGIIGFFSPWTFGISLLTLLEGSLTGTALLTQPSIENSLPVILLVPLGTLTICLALATSRRRWKRIVAFAVAGLAVVNVVGWSIIWSPRTSTQFVRIAPSAAATLERALSMIPANNEVIASQGVVGPFSFRQWVYALLINPPDRFPINSRTVWFVIAPNTGIEQESPSGAQLEIGQIVSVLHARLMLHSNGIYVFRWTPTPHRTSVAFHGTGSIPAWSLSSTAGHAVLVGPVDRWHVEATGGEGYMVANDYWHANAGTLTSTVRLASNGPVNVEIWDISTDRLLARAGLTTTFGVLKEVKTSTDLTRSQPQSAYSGPWPFKILPVNPTPEDIIEIRIWTPGNVHVSVYSVKLTGSHVSP